MTRRELDEYLAWAVTNAQRCEARSRAYNNGKTGGEAARWRQLADDLRWRIEGFPYNLAPVCGWTKPYRDHDPKCKACEKFHKRQWIVAARWLTVVRK